MCMLWTTLQWKISIITCGLCDALLSTLWHLRLGHQVFVGLGGLTKDGICATPSHSHHCLQRLAGPVFGCPPPSCFARIARCSCGKSCWIHRCKEQCRNILISICLPTQPMNEWLLATCLCRSCLMFAYTYELMCTQRQKALPLPLLSAAPHAALTACALHIVARLSLFVVVCCS